MTEPNAMREIHEIRERIYEETKHMTPEEKTTRVLAETAEIKRQYNFKTVDFTESATKQVKRKA